MGFRSTFCTEDFGIEWPAWFVEKYDGIVRFRADNKGALHSIGEGKTYGIYSELHTDIQKAVAWGEGYNPDSLVLVYLHECGGVTRCEIRRDAVVWTEPTEWRQTRGVEHEYCYGCSDAKRYVSLSAHCR